MPMRARVGSSQKRKRARMQRMLAEEEENTWLDELKQQAKNDTEKEEAIRLTIKKRLILRGRLDPNEVPEKVLEQEEPLVRLRKHVRCALVLEAKRRIDGEERGVSTAADPNEPNFPSWTPLWIHLTWRPAPKPETLEERERKKPGAAHLIQKRYRFHQRRHENEAKEEVHLNNRYMGSPDDPLGPSPDDPASGRRLKLLFYVILLIFWTVASLDSRQPDKYQQTAVIHTHLSISNDLESPPKSLNAGAGRRLQTGGGDDQEAVMSEPVEENAESGGNPQFQEIRTRAQLKKYMEVSLRRASVELAMSASKSPFHSVTGIRVRQQRVKPSPCHSGQPFHHLAQVQCHPNFRMGEEDRAPFGPGGQWTYTDGSEVRGYTRGTDTCGKLGRYDTGGYLLETFEDDPVLNGSNSSSGRRVLKGAKKGKMALGGGKSGPWANQLAFDMWATAAGVPWDDTVSKYWIDDQTRAVFIDVTVYNPSLRIVSVVRLVVEITDTGQCIPTFLVNTMRQRHFFDPEDIQSWAEWGLILLIGLLTVRDVLEGVRDAHALASELATKHGKASLKSTALDLIKKDRVSAAVLNKIKAAAGATVVPEPPESNGAMGNVKIKGAAADVPANKPADIPAESPSENPENSSRNQKRIRKRRKENAVRQQKIDDLNQEVDEARKLEIRQRLLGELHAKRLWRMFDLLNYTLFLIPLTMEGAARRLLQLTFNEVIAMEQEERFSIEADENSTDTSNVSHLEHISFFLPGSLSRMATTLLALNAVLTWAKMLKYLSAFPYIGMLSITLAHAYYETLCFLILFFNLFVGWSMAFSMAFGGHMLQYSTVPEAMMSLFRMILGDYEFDDMYAVDRLAAMVLFVVYIIVAMFLLSNMFVAMLSNSYNVAKTRVMGDEMTEQNKDKWGGAESFMAYMWRMLTDYRACKPCKTVKVDAVNEQNKQDAMDAAVLWIGGIPAGASQEGLERLLGRYGHPKVFLREKEGERASWALASFKSTSEAAACVGAANPAPGEHGLVLPGLVLPALESTDGHDVELKVQWSSEGQVAKQLLANPEGGLADAWFEMQMAGAVNTDKRKSTWSPYEQTAMVNVMVRGETKKMWELLEATRETDRFLGGPMFRQTLDALETKDGFHGLIPEAQYLKLSLAPANVEARKKFAAAGLAVMSLGKVKGYQRTPREDLEDVVEASGGVVFETRHRMKTFGGQHLKKRSSQPVAL